MTGTLMRVGSLPSAVIGGVHGDALTTGYLLGYAGAATLAVALTGYALATRGDRPTVRAFAALGVALAVWAGGYVGRLLTQGLVDKFVWHVVAYAGILATPPLFVLFALRYTNRDEWVTPAVGGGLVALPAAAWLLLVTDPLFGLYYRSVGVYRVGTAEVFTSAIGPGFWIGALSGWLLMAVGIGLLGSFAVRSAHRYRPQVLAVLAAATLPLASNVLYAAGVRPHPVLDPTPVVWSVAAAGVAASLFRSHFLDLLPMARASAFRAAADAIVVVDGQGRIVDHNAVARSLFVSTPPPDDASTDATADPIGAEATAALVAPIAGVLTDGEGADDPVDRECTVRPSAGGPSRQYLVGRRPVVAGQADRGVVLTATDITTQKRQQQRLSRQNKRLDQFASIVSHDLRNPLGVADGFTDLARERLGAADDDEPVGTVREDVDAHLDRVARAVDRMDVLVEDVLTLARQGQAVTDVTDLSLETVAREAWTDLDAPTASLEVETDCIVRAEESRLRRLFGNLFRNAVEHGGPDVTVRVGPGAGAVDDVDGGAPAGTAVAAETDRPATASESVEYSGFHVSDDGPGIPVEDRATVFETGYTTATTGTGMGLSIVEGIAEAHGWQVSLGDAPSGGLQVVLEGVEGRPVAGRDG